MTAFTIVCPDEDIIQIRAIVERCDIPDMKANSNTELGTICAVRILLSENSKSLGEEQLLWEG